MADNLNKKDAFSYLSNLPIDQILESSDFVKQPEVILSQNKVRELLKEKYPKFNFEELDSDSVSEIAGRAVILANLSQKVVHLAQSGNVTEAHTLARKVKLIGDPEVSEVETSVKNIIETTHGNLDMAASFLNLNKKTGRSWLNFIIRTWGVKPSDFK